MTGPGNWHIEIQFFRSQGVQEGPLFQAHRLLRAPVALEILGNQLPTNRVHGMGWALLLRNEQLHSDNPNDLAAPALLQWEHHPAWWLPIEADLEH